MNGSTDLLVNVLIFLAGVVLTAAATWGANRGQYVASTAAVASVADAARMTRDEIFRRLETIEKRLDRFDEDIRELSGLFREILARLTTRSNEWDGIERRTHQRRDEHEA